jgi:hypothetical protein
MDQHQTIHICKMIGQILATIHIAVRNQHDAFGVEYTKFLPYVDSRKPEFIKDYIFWIITHQYGFFTIDKESLKNIIDEYLEST